MPDTLTDQILPSSESAADKSEANDGRLRHFVISCSDRALPDLAAHGFSREEILSHVNLGNLALAGDLNCASAMQFAVDVCEVESLSVIGHLGCRAIGAAMNRRSAMLLRQWLSPIAGLAAKYSDMLGVSGDSQTVLDRLSALNAIEQAARLCRGLAVSSAWQRRQKLTVNGLILDRNGCVLPQPTFSAAAVDDIDPNFRQALENISHRIIA
ncbi:MAG: carbonic anhydrase [bacterium]|nr:carbonic anhydrase [bacterium]